MNEGGDAHERLAARVAEGEPIDWDAEIHGAADERQRRMIRHLRLVEGVARAHIEMLPRSPERLPRRSRFPRGSEGTDFSP